MAHTARPFFNRRGVTTLGQPRPPRRTAPLLVDLDSLLSDSSNLDNYLIDDTNSDELLLEDAA